jgi:hypothetical protein
MSENPQTRRRQNPSKAKFAERPARAHDEYVQTWFVCGVKDPSDGREAEVAVVVEEARRSRVMDRLLLLGIAGEVRRVDVEMFTCTTPQVNYQAHAIVSQRSKSHVGGTCSIRVPLTAQKRC